MEFCYVGGCLKIERKLFFQVTIQVTPKLVTEAYYEPSLKYASTCLINLASGLFVSFFLIIFF